MKPPYLIDQIQSTRTKKLKFILMGTKLLYEGSPEGYVGCFAGDTGNKKIAIVCG